MRLPSDKTVRSIAPVDPAAIIAGDYANPNDVVQIRQKLGLDEPIYMQFGCGWANYCGVTWDFHFLRIADDTAHRPAA